MLNYECRMGAKPSVALRHSAFSIYHSTFLFDDFINIRQIPPLLVIIQSIAHDELVPNVHAYIVDGVGVLEIVGLEEQCGDAHVGGFQVAEFLRGVTQGVSRVDDVFHDDHMAAVQGTVQADKLADDIGGFSAGVLR